MNKEGNMLPFGRLVKYGNVVPPQIGRYKIYSSSASLFLLDTQTHKLYSSSTLNYTSGTGNVEPKFVLSATNVKRLLLSDNSCAMQIYEDMNGRAAMCGTRTAYSGVANDNVLVWTDCTTWFTTVGLNVSDIQYMSGFYNLKLNVVMNNGDLWCSGKNNTSTTSSFGNNTNIDSFNKFTKITTISNVIKATGNIYLRADNTLWGCGINSYYQLGTGNQTSSISLILIASNVIDSNVGLQNTYYLTNNKELYGCGTQFGTTYGNEFGTGRQGTAVQYKTPTVLFTDADGLAVCVGNMSTHVIQYNKVFSSGNNALAQLSVGNRDNVYTYTQSFDNFQMDSSIVRTNVGTLILTADNKLYYSGRNDVVMGGTSTQFTTVFSEVDMSFIQ